MSRLTDAIRYADPISNAKTQGYEAQLKEILSSISKAELETKIELIERGIAKERIGEFATTLL